MTLIVAKTFDDRAYIIADTKITDQNDLHANPYSKGGSKIVPFFGAYVVAYAGNSALFEKLVSDLGQVREVHAARATCLRHQEASNNSLDLILMDQATRQMWLYQSSVERYGQRFWLGSKQAYERFQRYRITLVEKRDGLSTDNTAPLPTEAQISFSIDLRAAQETFSLNAFDVGGFAVPYQLSSLERGFGYYLTAELPQQIKRGETTNLQFYGDASEGAMTLEFVGRKDGFDVTISPLGARISWTSPFAH